MIDPITSFLFCDDFPRELTPKRFLIRNQQEFERKIDDVNGIYESFTNVNPINGTINKIFSDFDGMPLSLEEGKKLYIHCMDSGIPTIPQASGRKGVHLFSRFRPFKGQTTHETKEVLRKTSKSIYIKAYGESYEIKTLDPRLIGNIRGLCRIPNTLRPPTNDTFCTPLPPGKAFLEMTPQDIQWYIKGTHQYEIKEYFEVCNCKLTHLPSFKDFIIPEVDEMEIHFPDEEFDTSAPCYENSILKQVLRPCLYRLITVEEPRHDVRLAVTTDLLLCDFTPSEILSIFRSLNWIDYDEQITRDAILSCKPILWKRKTLKSKGICNDPKCKRQCI